MKPTTREWVKKAENDFTVATQILRRRKEIVPDAACFFCQQCVEKYLKSLFENPPGQGTGPTTEGGFDCFL